MLGDLDVAWLPSNCFTFQRLSNGARSVGISLGGLITNILFVSNGCLIDADEDRLWFPSNHRGTFDVI